MSNSTLKVVHNMQLRAPITIMLNSKSVNYYKFKPKIGVLLSLVSFFEVRIPSELSYSVSTSVVGDCLSYSGSCSAPSYNSLP